MITEPSKPTADDTRCPCSAVEELLRADPRIGRDQEVLDFQILSLYYDWLRFPPIYVSGCHDNIFQWSTKIDLEPGTRGFKHPAMGSEVNITSLRRHPLFAGYLAPSN